MSLTHAFTQNRTFRTAGLLAAAVLVWTAAGCRVHVNKGANGEDKQVQVETPFGGMHVDTNQTTASDLGLPAYPGAQIVPDKDNDKSANVHMGFGPWELRVKVVNYSTADGQDKVTEFYKKALGSYGDVIVCQGKSPVGTPVATSGGLTCADNGKGSQVKVEAGTDFDYESDHNGLELKAGSEHHQHIVAFGKPSAGQTRFTLVAIDLPSGTGSSGKSD